MKCCAWRYSIWSLIHFIAKVGVAPAMACPQLRISAWQPISARSCVGSHPILGQQQISIIHGSWAVQQWGFETEGVFSPLEVTTTPWMSVQSILCLIGTIPRGDSDGNDGITVSYVLLLKNAQRNLGKSWKICKDCQDNYSGVRGGKLSIAFCVVTMTIHDNPWQSYTRKVVVGSCSPHTRWLWQLWCCSSSFGNALTNVTNEFSDPDQGVSWIQRFDDRFQAKKSQMQRELPSMKSMKRNPGSKDLQWLVTGNCTFGRPVQELGASVCEFLCRQAASCSWVDVKCEAEQIT